MSKKKRPTAEPLVFGRNVAGRFIEPERVRQLAHEHNPEYGKDFTDQDWDRIAQRLESLARLLWRFSWRETSKRKDVQ